MDSTFQWPESGNYFTGLEVYHLLHCLVCTNSFHTVPIISSNHCWRSGTMLTASTSTTVTGTTLSLRGTTLPLLWCPWWGIAPEEEPTSRSCCILAIHAGAVLFHVKKRGRGGMATRVWFSNRSWDPPCIGKTSTPMGQGIKAFIMQVYRSSQGWRSDWICGRGTPLG